MDAPGAVREDSVQAADGSTPSPEAAGTDGVASAPNVAAPAGTALTEEPAGADDDEEETR
ncbi:MAG TPA: hypothetical protein DHV14_11265 [Micrococcales bacterium]|nr:hypothetical protein [Micrococcales bacterium]